MIQTSFEYVDCKIHFLVEEDTFNSFEDNDKFYYTNLVYDNKDFHREDGPAFEWIGGHKDWYYHGERIYCKDNEEFLKIISMKAFL